MKKHLLALLLLCIGAFTIKAQVYIDQSHTYGTNATEDLEYVLQQGDYMYFVGTTHSRNFPVTNTSQTPATLNTTADNEWSYYKKVNKATGAVVVSAYIGPHMYGHHFKVRDGKVYIVGAADDEFTEPNRVNGVTGGAGGDLDYLYLELDENTGDILFAKYFGGSDYEDCFRMDVNDNYVVFGNYTNSSDIPVTDTTTNPNGSDRLAIFVLDKATRNTAFSTYFASGPDYSYWEIADYILDGNKLYVIGQCYNPEKFEPLNDVNNIPNVGEEDAAFLARLDLTTYTWDYKTIFMAEYYVETYFQYVSSVKSDNNYIYMVGGIDQNAVSPYTATNGTKPSTPPSTLDDPLYLKIDKNTGGIVASSYFGGSDHERIYNLHVDGNSVYIAGNTRSTNLPVTDGSVKTGAANEADGYYAHFDGTTAQILNAGYLGLTNSSNDIRITTDNNYLHLAAVANDMNPINGGQATKNPSSNELVYIRKDKNTGQSLFAGFFGDGNDNTEPFRIHSDDSGYVYISGEMTSDYDFPITTPGVPSTIGGLDFYYMRLGSCDIMGNFSNDTLSPATQTVCQFEYGPKIDGQPVVLSGDSLPLIYRNMQPETQGNFEASYQWQESSSPTGPWINISAGILEDYQPSIGATTQYFRRLSYIKSCGDSNLVSTSSVATVNTNSFVAPTVSAGGIYNSCSGVSVTIGGAPSATGGTPPYSYSWLRGGETVPFDTIANPTTSANVSSINTLWVTDANGCVQVDQSVLNILKVDAGPDRAVCSGDSAQVLTKGAAGLAGVSYAWSPTSGVDCPTCLQPKIFVNSPADYEVSMTIPVTGGGTCTTVDTVMIHTPPAPSNPNFGGPDKLICFSGTTGLGTTPDLFSTTASSVSQSTTDSAATVANITDNDFSTGGATNSAFGQYFEFDFGEKVTIYGIEVASVSPGGLDNARLEYLHSNGVSWIPAISSLGMVSDTGLSTKTTSTPLTSSKFRIRRYATQAINISEIRFLTSFNYTWAPGGYLSSNALPQVTYNPGSLEFPPTPDSAIYYVTAELDGCVYFDTVVVDVIRAHAGDDGCGPRFLGEDTDVPTLNEQFIWTKISGPGSFLTATNIPYPQVDGSDTGTSVYQLQTVYKGDTCTDLVVVPPCGCGVDIKVDAPFGCPNTALGTVPLRGVSSFGDNVIWDWSPKVGLSSYNTAIVYLTDTVTRTYAVTARSSIDTTKFCTDSILVNHPSMNLPVFTAVDSTICSGDSLNIGALTVANYDYYWTPLTSNLSSHSISDPVAYLDGQNQDYVVRVTDVGTGCRLYDTASITVVGVSADAGPDWQVCNNATIQLGTPAVAGQFYFWSPNAPWQNGTDSSSAQPEPLIATGLTFFLEVTDSITGCKAYDTAVVVVDNNPTLPNFPDITACEGGSVYIGADLALPGVTYSWSPTTGLANPNSIYTLATPPSNQTYLLTATYPGNCNSAATDQVALTINNFNFSLTDTTYCPSGGAFALGGGVPTGTGYSYAWSPANMVSSSTIANPNTPTSPPSFEVTYTVTVTNNNGCVDTGSRTITPSTIQPDAGSNQNICINGTANLGNTTSSGNTGGVGITYSWSPTTDLSCTTCADPTFTPSATGTYTYTLTRTDANLSCSSTDDVTITVNDLPLGALPQPVICQNSSVQIGTMPTAGTTYIWSPTTGLSDSTISNPIASSTSNIIYTLTAIGNTGCVAQEDVAITINPTPPPTVNADAVTVCQSAGGGVMNATVSAGSHTYQWSPTTGLNDPYALNPSFIAGNTGSTVYTLLVTDGSTGCTASDTALITIDDCLASMGNYVWYDNNEDGIQDSTELGVSGVKVFLLNSVGQVIDSTFTISSGYYLFDDLVPANYGIRFDLSTLPIGYVVTTQDAGSDDEADSDADNVTGNAGYTTLVENENNMSFDMGIYFFTPSPNSIGNYVWNDINQDGIQDGNEVGVAGITVTLYDNAGNVIGTTVTDAYGKYLFEGLEDGDYEVGFTLPANYVFTQQNTPGDNGDNTNSDVNPATGKTITYTLSGDEMDLSADAGIYFETVTPPASAGDYVWYDVNMDGVQDAGEVGISGVTVTLFDNAGNPVATTITDGDGKYLFTDVVPGTYSVGFTPPAGLGFSPNTGGVGVTNNSDANTTTGKTSTFTVAAGDTIRHVDAGLHNAPTTVGSLGDRVWYDTDQDGIQDAGEVGSAGVTVTLYDSTGTNVLATTETDGFGNYIFPNLSAGKYVVGFTTPSGYTVSPEGASTDSTVNSDANTTTGKTGVIMLAQGEHNPTIDAGIFNSTPANNNSIGGYVWHDEDQGGVQDTNEEGVAGITVTLYDNAGSPIATTTTDANGYYNFPFLPNGTYSVGFSNLPEEFVFSEQNATAGTTATDSDPDPQTGKTSTVSLTGNTHITDLDAGIYEGEMNIGTASLGNQVWYDTDGDGIQDPEELGVSGVTVYLYDSAGTTILDSTVTDALGNYIFTDLDPDTYCVQFTNTPAGFTFSPQDADSEGANGPDNSDVNTATGKSDPIVLTEGEDNLNINAGLVPPTGTASLGDQVWYDLDKDGIQDVNEPGVPGIQVCLLDNTGSTIAVTTTDINGNYQFIGLTPGDYQVGFKNLPSGYTLTTQDADNGGINGTMNSDADSTTGLTSTITLTANQYNPNVDAGIQTNSVGSIGDYVWCDEDGDGIQDASEPGIAGVLVTLYDNASNPVASTLTDENGAYLFSNVTPGTYTMGFTNLPSSKEFTTNDAGTNDSTDSDVDPMTGTTSTFTVTAGEHNPTIDVGLRTPIPCGLGNYVWHDVNEDGIQDVGEPPVSGVLVSLYASDGTTILAQAITDGNGFYQFGELPAGVYSVGFGNLPPNATPTQSNGSINTTDNSDMNPVSLKTSNVTLTEGEFNPNLDGGIYFGVPLPVRLGEFSVTKSVCDVRLYWTTLSERNTSHFNVMRSHAQSAGQFEKLTEVPAAGNSSIEQVYTYTDKYLDGNYIYKLEIIDIDRKTSESKTTGITINCSSDGLIKLYPNPVEDNLQVLSQLDQKDYYVVKLYDMVGKVIYETSREVKKGNDVFVVSMSSLASGSYMLEIQSENIGKQEFKVQKK